MQFMNGIFVVLRVKVEKRWRHFDGGVWIGSGVTIKNATTERDMDD